MLALVVACGGLSSDGTEPPTADFVFVSNRDGNLDLFAVRADGSGEPLLLAGGPGREAEGRWRPRSEAC